MHREANTPKNFTAIETNEMGPETNQVESTTAHKSKIAHGPIFIEKYYIRVSTTERLPRNDK